MNPSTHANQLPPLRRHALVAVGVGCLLGITACGGSGSHPTKTASVVTPPPATTVAQTVSPQSTTSSGTKSVAAHAPTTKATSATTSTPAAPTVATPAARRRAEIIAKKNARARHVAPHQPPRWAATPEQSATVLGCLNRAHLAHVSAVSTVLWSGYAANVAKFVYVDLFQTPGGARSYTHTLADEEVAPAGRYAVTESIAPYRGSPVAAVTVCLGGKPPKVGGSKKGSGGKRKFTF